ncbi:MAG: cyclic nucleotide-binding domain-containing protein, partial [Planctomycetes bacterium]|nr:cyclic nucleotide-binding domain-containing protein [Planctomycetota bacterium]
MSGRGEEVARFLGGVALFAGLLPARRRALADEARDRALAPHQALFREGERCAALHVVERGTVKVFNIGPSGREWIHYLARRGAVILEAPLFPIASGGAEG